MGSHNFDAKAEAAFMCRPKLYNISKASQGGNNVYGPGRGWWYRPSSDRRPRTRDLEVESSAPKVFLNDDHIH